MRDQTRNRRSNIWVELVDGRRMVLADAAAEFKVTRGTVYSRLRKDWPEERLLERIWEHPKLPPKFDPSRSCKIIR